MRLQRFAITLTGLALAATIASAQNISAILDSRSADTMTFAPIVPDQRMVLLSSFHVDSTEATARSIVSGLEDPSGFAAEYGGILCGCINVCTQTRRPPAPHRIKTTPPMSAWATQLAETKWMSPAADTTRLKWRHLGRFGDDPFEIVNMRSIPTTPRGDRFDLLRAQLAPAPTSPAQQQVVTRHLIPVPRSATEESELRRRGAEEHPTIR